VTATGIELRLTFDGMRPEQIERRWAGEVGGLEAYVFDAAELAEPSGWERFRRSLRHARRAAGEQLTCHFPTENADWVTDRTAFTTLLRFCHVAAESGAAGVVLHSNQFVRQEDWRHYDLADARARVTERLAELDRRLDGAPLWIGVENMPVIGAEGDDYDAVFVTPADFTPLLQLESPRIGVTWDVCHWAVTCATAASVAQLQRREPEVTADDLPVLPIRHIHFGSYRGMAMPFRPEVCHEGVPPQEGDAAEDLLARMLLRAADAAPTTVGVVLEIQEQDYLARKNCWRTLDWLLSRPDIAARLGDGGRR